MTNLVRSITASSTPQSSLVVAHDASAGRLKPLTPAQVASSKDAVLRQTVANASDVMSFLKDRFGRNGLDGKGQKLDIVVHMPDPTTGGPMSNAFWHGQTGKMYIGDGDGKMFKPLGSAKDIIAHEAGHAILEAEVQMGFDGQEGALHESFGDVIASLVDPQDWQIGEDAFTPSKAGDALRDMSKPANFTNMSQVPGGTAEPHDLADIPNLAAVRVAEKIGRNEMGKVWYDGFTTYMKDNADFTAAAQATIEAATNLYGKDSARRPTYGPNQVK